MNYETSAAIFQQHIDKYQYKSGANKGDAPGDPSRRRKNHYRVARHPSGAYYVRFWNTNIITLNLDGTFTLNTDFHDSSPTTRVAMNGWLSKLGLPFRIWSHRTAGFSQTVLANVYTRHLFVYYDGMVVQGDKVLSALRPFRAKRVDTDKTKEYRRQAKESGFLDVFPVLWATVDVAESSTPVPVHHPDSIFDVAGADAWSGVVRRAAREHRWVGTKYSVVKRDKQETLKAIMKLAMGNVYKVVDTEETIRML